MKKKIKIGNNIGVAIQVQGLTVDAEPHPVYKDTWRFKVDDDVWIASDHAFEKEE